MFLVWGLKIVGIISNTEPPSRLPMAIATNDRRTVPEICTFEVTSTEFTRGLPLIFCQNLIPKVSPRKT